MLDFALVFFFFANLTTKILNANGISWVCVWHVMVKCDTMQYSSLFCFPFHWVFIERFAIYSIWFYALFFCQSWMFIVVIIILDAFSLVRIIELTWIFKSRIFIIVVVVVKLCIDLKCNFHFYYDLFFVFYLFI